MQSRLDIRYRTVQAEGRVVWSGLATLRLPTATLLDKRVFGLCNGTVEFLHEPGADGLVNEAIHSVRVLFG